MFSMTQEPTDNKYQCSVVICSDTAEGQRIQSDIVACALACQYTEPELFAIRLAVEEALVNAIKHGNGADRSKKVRIDYAVTRDEVCVRIEDEGPGFDPEAVPDPTQPEFLERPCGRGLMLMRYYMSCVDFKGRGNCVEMRKRRGEQPNNGSE
jgi:serine/threonine-protein kinase RsbW